MLERHFSRLLKSPERRQSDAGANRERRLLPAHADPRLLRVCGWSEGPTPWPLVRVGHGGKGALAMTPELARAIPLESEAAIIRWLGVGMTTVSKWRRALGVKQFNEGTLKLYSLWKEEKLPDSAIPFSPAALRRMRIRRGMTCRHVCRLAGWASNTSYDQMEKGLRRQATMPTLERLAAIFESELLPQATRMR